MRSLLTAAGIPRLAAQLWPPVFEVLADYAATHEFNLSESTRWARDELTERGHEVGRTALNFTVRAVSLGGKPLHTSPPPKPAELAHAFVQSVLNGGLAAQLAFTDDELDEIHAWFGATRDGDRASVDSVADDASTRPVPAAER